MLCSAVGTGYPGVLDCVHGVQRMAEGFSWLVLNSARVCVGCAANWRHIAHGAPFFPLLLVGSKAVGLLHMSGDVVCASGRTLSWVLLSPSRIVQGWLLANPCGRALRCDSRLQGAFPYSVALDVCLHRHRSGLPRWAGLPLPLVLDAIGLDGEANIPRSPLGSLPRVVEPCLWRCWLRSAPLSLLSLSFLAVIYFSVKNGGGGRVQQYD